MDIEAYLDRIGIKSQPFPDLENLRVIQRAHIEHIPFENLDIFLGKQIKLDIKLFYDKIVYRRRGGFCYELNGLFATLLSELGYDVTLLSARVYDGRIPGPEFDHLVLLVDTPESSNSSYLVDVGFGDAFRFPLLLQSGPVQSQRWGKYRLSDQDGDWTYWSLSVDDRWKPQYCFSLHPRSLIEFSGMCHYHQISSDSAFTRKRITTIGTQSGRITLSEMRLIMKTNKKRQEILLADEIAYNQALHDHFDIKLERSVWQNE